MNTMADRQTFEHSDAKLGNGKLATCWSCKGPVDRGALFCPTCGIVQPPHAADHFQRLGLNRGFDIGDDVLSRRYFDLQARLHPDRFASRTATERAASLAQATALNEAYQTLRDPLSRAAYLLQLAGIEAPTEASGTVADPELLMESLERREALAEAQLPEEISKIVAAAEEDAKACVGVLSKAFASGDLEEAKRLTTRFKYLNKLAEEARARLSRAPC